MAALAKKPTSAARRPGFGLFGISKVNQNTTPRQMAAGTCERKRIPYGNVIDPNPYATVIASTANRLPPLKRSATRRKGTNRNQIDGSVTIVARSHQVTVPCAGWLRISRSSAYAGIAATDCPGALFG